MEGLKAFLKDFGNLDEKNISNALAHLSNNDVFYREKMFILAYMGDSQFTHRASTIKELAEIYDYPLAQYIINRHKEKLIDGCQFTGLFFPGQLNFIVDHLLKY